ncbi:MAG: hypothetical protein M3552_04685 [Planctomycetota bacterium]|nr:hypothetical protein [Planctomycetaceae bacterium]MDQ3329936.1 hypothetical protein [Planctomycetota bacterium]
MIKHSKRFSSPAALATALVLACLGGCQNGLVAAPVDVSVAQQTLTRVLDGWKAGATVESFQTETPPVVVQDRDWQTGLALIDYESRSPGKAFDANLHCDVTLTLRDADGKEVKKDVIYIVGTDPVLTVFRQIL